MNLKEISKELLDNGITFKKHRGNLITGLSVHGKTNLNFRGEHDFSLSFCNAFGHVFAAFYISEFFHGVDPTCNFDDPTNMYASWEKYEIDFSLMNDENCPRDWTNGSDWYSLWKAENTETVSDFVKRILGKWEELCKVIQETRKKEVSDQLAFKIIEASVTNFVNKHENPVVEKVNRKAKCNVDGLTLMLEWTGSTARHPLRVGIRVSDKENFGNAVEPLEPNVMTFNWKFDPKRNVEKTLESVVQKYKEMTNDLRNIQ